jgi:hypothetical protein
MNCRSTPDRNRNRRMRRRPPLSQTAAPGVISTCRPLARLLGTTGHDRVSSHHRRGIRSHRELRGAPSRLDALSHLTFPRPRSITDNHRRTPCDGSQRPCVNEGRRLIGRSAPGFLKPGKSASCKPVAGEPLIARLLTSLPARFERGFSRDNLESMRRILPAYPRSLRSETMSRRFNLVELRAGLRLATDRLSAPAFGQR